MAGFRLVTVLALRPVVSLSGGWVAAPSTAAKAVPYLDQDADENSLLQQVSLASFRAIPQQKFAEMAAGAAQCAVSGVGCGPQVDEFESLLQMPKVDSGTGVRRQREETAKGEEGASPSSAGGEEGRGGGRVGRKGLKVALNKDSAEDKHRKMSTQHAIHAALEQNAHVSDALHSAVRQEEEATQEAAKGTLMGSKSHGFLRYALEQNTEARKALQSAAQEEEKGTSLAATQEAIKGKRRRTTSQEAIYAALEQNAHLSYALRSAVQQEEASIQEAARGHRVGAEHNGKLNHGFINYALQLDEKVSQALQSAVQGEEEDTSPVATQLDEAIYSAMEQVPQQEF